MVVFDLRSDSAPIRMPRARETSAPPPGLEPTRVGEHPALDFLNSVFAPDGDVLDFLHDGATLARWLARSGVVPDPVGASARALSPRQLERLAAQARALREWFGALVLRWCAEGERAVSQADIARLNALMSASPLTQVVVRRTSGLELRAQRTLGGPQALMAELAATCASLLADLRHEKVRKCENPLCTLVFADNKRGPRRRWCSMAVCGNRMKAAAHRARRQRRERVRVVG